MVTLAALNRKRGYKRTICAFRWPSGSRHGNRVAMPWARYTMVSEDDLERTPNDARPFKTCNGTVPRTSHLVIGSVRQRVIESTEEVCPELNCLLLANRE